MAGKFIVIDGTDGSGKTTQAEILIERLKDLGRQVEMADFPQYNTKSAGLVENYLEGKYGGIEDVGPKIASIFYAVDRYDASFKIRRWLDEGKVVISNRYVSANMGHQGAKIKDDVERKQLFGWLDELEYGIFNIPRPDMTLILHVPAETSQQLSQEREREDWNNKTKDIHQENLEHLKLAEKTYLEMTEIYPDCELIECTKNNKIMSREGIANKVFETVKEII